jgi:excisionase family DNA binding protein
MNGVNVQYQFSNQTHLLNQREAAKYLGTTVGTLNSWRYQGKLTIPFLQWGNRIRYRQEDLDTWIESKIVR